MDDYADGPPCVLSSLIITQSTLLISLTTAKVATNIVDADDWVDMLLCLIAGSEVLRTASVAIDYWSINYHTKDRYVNSIG